MSFSKKLIVQIPCLNEEATLSSVLKSIPKKIKGIDRVEILVIDDGSTDHTVEIAKLNGADHIVCHAKNRGLANAFASGLEAALRLGADIIVNTDADNQYPQKDIPKLIEPIIKGKADMVIGDRQTSKIQHFSRDKKFLQWLGSFVVRKLSDTEINDAVSGFRAYSREAALQLNIVTGFSYVIETIIQAKHKRIAMCNIKIKTNPPTRESRLFKGNIQHIKYSLAALIRVYTMYQPLNVFLSVGIVISLIGSIFGFRFIYFYSMGQGDGHIQSLILAAILITVGFQIIMTGLVADLISINRKLTEVGLNRLKSLELKIFSSKNKEIDSIYPVA